MTHAEATRRFYVHIWPLRGTLLRTATFLTRSPGEAEDLVQETLMKAFRAMDSFDERSNATAWVSAILRHTRIDRLRASARGLPTVSLDQLETEVAAKDAAGVEAAAPATDAAAILARFSDAEVIRALQHLPEEIRWTLLLVDVEDLDYREAAEVLDIPAGTVKSRLHRGRLMLRDALVCEKPGLAGARSDHEL